MVEPIIGGRKRVKPSYNNPKQQEIAIEFAKDIITQISDLIKLCFDQIRDLIKSNNKFLNLKLIILC